MNGFVGKYGTDDGDVFLTTHYHINVFANLEEGSVLWLPWNEIDLCAHSVDHFCQSLVFDHKRNRQIKSRCSEQSTSNQFYLFRGLVSG